MRSLGRSARGDGGSLRPFVARIGTALALAASALLIPASANGVLAQSDTSPSHVVDAFSQTDDDAAEALAQKHAPIVVLRNQREPCDDQGQVYFPAPVEIVLENPNIVLRQNTEDGRVEVKRGATGFDLFGLDSSHSLDFPGDPTRPGCGYEQAFRELARTYSPVAYAHIAREDGHEGLALQYWFYYYFNDWNNKHEGDWEMIQLAFDAESPEEALQQEPASVAYAQHGSGERGSWEDDKLTREGDRPFVYVATGAGASFYTQDLFFGKGEEGTGFGCDDASAPGRRVDPDVRLLPEPEDVDASHPFAWIAYDGRWGQEVKRFFDGPRGPQTQRQWSEPFSWEDGLRDASIVVPLDRGSAPNAVVWFCGFARIGSRLLFEGGPWLVLGLVLFAFASVTVTARRTAFRPARSEPLRRTRRFGQILTSSFAIYRDRLAVFLAIGAIYVPLGLVTTAFQALLVSFTPFGTFVELAENTVVGAAAVLGVGLLQFGLTYWLVLVVVVAVLSELDRGEDTGAASAVRSLRGKVWRLLVARGGAVAALVGLALIPIVGWVIAVYVSVRWTFLEQAVLLDDARIRDAYSTSGGVVRGQWWRTLGITFSVVAVAISLGPVIGVALVLATTLALPFVNIISSLFYMALIPFAAIALTLLYFDLQAQEPERR
jgi:hypothetical protein